MLAENKPFQAYILPMASILEQLFHPLTLPAGFWKLYMRPAFRVRLPISNLHK